MRYLTLIIAALALAGCTLFQAVAPGAAEFSRERFVDGLGLYCTQSQPVRAENRAWINANSPHTIEVTCAGDEVHALFGCRPGQ